MLWTVEVFLFFLSGPVWYAVTFTHLSFLTADNNLKHWEVIHPGVNLSEVIKVGGQWSQTPLDNPSAVNQMLKDLRSITNINMLFKSCKMLILWQKWCMFLEEMHEKIFFSPQGCLPSQRVWMVWGLCSWESCLEGRWGPDLHLVTSERQKSDMQLFYWAAKPTDAGWYYLFMRKRKLQPQMQIYVSHWE